MCNSGADQTEPGAPRFVIRVSAFPMQVSDSFRAPSFNRSLIEGWETSKARAATNPHRVRSSAGEKQLEYPEREFL